MPHTAPTTLTEDAPDVADVPVDERTPGTGYSVGELVLGTALVLVAVHVALRAWMLWPSWFYGDDYALVGEADAAGLSPGELLDPYAGQFMPLGRLVAWVVADAGPLDWHAAALSVVAMVVLADLACVWMLLELFGRRWGILLPLTAYLTSAVLMPATMWWAAGLNQLPLQAVMLGAVASWARYLRTGRRRWWVVALVVIGIGLLAYVKTLLVPVVLVWLALAHHATGGPGSRLRQVVRRHAAPLGVLVTGGVAFLVWYVSAVPSIVTPGGRQPVALDLAGSMLGQALPVGLVGGPWRWDHFILPAALADPPAWSVVAAWLVLLTAAALLALRRRRTGRVWALLGVYAALTYLLVLTTRAPLVGGFIGFEYRYLTDLTPVAALCLGLATMELRGAPEPTVVRAGPPIGPLARWESLPAVVRSRLPVAVGVALALSGLWSSVTYARLWHTDHESHDYLDAVRAGLGPLGRVDVADQAAPEDAVSRLFFPWSQLDRLLPLAGLDVRFPQVSTRIALVGDDGVVSEGLVEPVIEAAPGPEEGCGYRATRKTDAGSVTVPFEREVPPGVYWLRLGYLSSAADTVTVTAGSVTGEAQVSKGLGNIFVDVGAGADSVTVTVDDETTLCLGDVEAGPLEEGPRW